VHPVELARVVGALGDDGGAEGVDGARGEDEAAAAFLGAGEEAHHVLARGGTMEPPLEVGRQQLLRPARVAGVERLVEAQHQEAVALLLRLLRPREGGQLRRLVRARRGRSLALVVGSQLQTRAPRRLLDLFARERGGYPATGSTTRRGRASRVVMEKRGRCALVEVGEARRGGLYRAPRLSV
jgi:hypothetical protein